MLVLSSFPFRVKSILESRKCKSLGVSTLCGNDDRRAEKISPDRTQDDVDGLEHQKIIIEGHIRMTKSRTEGHTCEDVDSLNIWGYYVSAGGLQLLAKWSTLAGLGDIKLFHLYADRLLRDPLPLCFGEVGALNVICRDLHKGDLRLWACGLCGFCNQLNAPFLRSTHTHILSLSLSHFSFSNHPLTCHPTPFGFHPGSVSVFKNRPIRYHRYSVIRFTSCC